MNMREWGRWVMQTARNWNDLSPVIRACGLDAVDTDHRRMIEYALEVNSLIETMKKPQLSMETIQREGRFLTEFFDYTAGHFRREESILAQYRLPRFEIHRTQHAEILDMMEGVIHQFEAGQINVAKSLKVSIMEWVVSHVNEVDYETFKVENWSWLLTSAKSWDDLSVFIRQMGIDDIDQQHKHLTVNSLEVCHILENMSGQSAPPEVILPFFADLKEQIATHFAYEETFMHRQGIQGLADHRGKHRGFIDQFDSFESELRQSGCVDPTKFARAILSWWVNHINEIDYATFCKNSWQFSSLERAQTAEQVAGIIRSTGVPQFDEEHRELVELTISLGATRESHKDSSDILTLLLAAAQRHFHHEEAFLESLGHPGLTNHRIEHGRLLAALGNHAAHFKVGRIGAIDDLRVRMLDWIVTHTNGYDYETFVRSGLVNTEARP